MNGDCTLGRFTVSSGRVVVSRRSAPDAVVRSVHQRRAVAAETSSKSVPVAVAADGGSFQCSGGGGAGSLARPTRRSRISHVRWVKTEGTDAAAASQPSSPLPRNQLRLILAGSAHQASNAESRARLNLGIQASPAASVNTFVAQAGAGPKPCNSPSAVRGEGPVGLWHWGGSPSSRYGPGGVRNRCCA